MLGGLDRGGAPFLYFFLGALTLELDLSAFAEQGDDLRDADFRRLADDIVHRGSLGQHLREREGGGTRGGGRGLFDAENRGRFAGLDTFSDPFAAVTIEDHHGITAAAAVDRDQMMALLGGEADFHRFALRRPAISAEVRHAERASWIIGEGQPSAAGPI